MLYKQEIPFSKVGPEAGFYDRDSLIQMPQYHLQFGYYRLHSPFIDQSPIILPFECTKPELTRASLNDHQSVTSDAQQTVFFLAAFQCTILFTNQKTVAI
jgi:hypothetical protein